MLAGSASVTTVAVSRALTTAVGGTAVGWGAAVGAGCACPASLLVAGAAVGGTAVAWGIIWGAKVAVGAGAAVGAALGSVLVSAAG